MKNKRQREEKKCWNTKFGFLHTFTDNKSFAILLIVYIKVNLPNALDEI